MAELTLSDGLLVFSTLIGPIAAVQAQKWIERSQQRKQRRLSLFQTLMATRAVRAGSNDHVQALNLIELFFDGRSSKERAVRDAWANYLDFLDIRLPENSSEDTWKAHNERGVDFLIELLKAMGESLGYEFNKVKLKRGVYYPQGHADEANILRSIRDGLAKVLNGELPLKMDVISLPISEAAAKNQDAIQASLLNLLSGTTSLKVKPEIERRS